MKPYYQDESVTVHHGDCIEVMRALPDGSVDSIVTDPPYGLGFMGRAWDALPPGLEWAEECFRVLKPGGHLLAFGGTRTWHRLAVAVEDAGFEIRDSIAWLYGSGFPKSVNVGRAVDTHVQFGGSSQTLQRRRDMGEGYRPHPSAGSDGFGDGNLRKGAAGDTQGEQAFLATPESKQWDGWGTALKPAFEPLVVARKPLIGTIAANVLTYGTGAFNIDANRIAGENPSIKRRQGSTTHLDGQREGAAAEHNASGRVVSRTSPERYTEIRAGEALGRFPANVILDEMQAEALDQQSGTLKSGILAAHHSRAPKLTTGIYGDMDAAEGERGYGDAGGASRFFPTFRYEAKAPSYERPSVGGVQHPTVKPLDLMRWLVRLVTPPGGTVLEPFAGSGTTAEACIVEGFKCIAIERDDTYLPLILSRIQKPIEVSLFGGLQ